MTVRASVSLFNGNQVTRTLRRVGKPCIWKVNRWLTGRGVGLGFPFFTSALHDPN
jgi:hypothetical protein